MSLDIIMKGGHSTKAGNIQKIIQQKCRESYFYYTSKFLTLASNAVYSRISYVYICIYHKNPIQNSSGKILVLTMISESLCGLESINK